MKTVSPSDFAKAFSISERTAQIAFRNAIGGKTWRGHTLPIVEMQSQRGGDGGKVFALRLDVAPPTVRAMFDVADTAIEQPLKGAFKGALSTASYDCHAERVALLQPILNTETRSAEREAAYASAVRKSGKSKKTLSNWVSAYNKDGPKALMPTQRADKGQKRVLITRAWDAGIGLPDDIKLGIANQLLRMARSMIANDGTSIREIIRQSEHELQKLSAKAGSPVPLAKLREICKLNRKWAKPVEHYKIVHIHDKDHKRWQDKHVSRIRRDLHPNPMGLLMGS